jgi:hypothetical protein
MLKPIKRVTQSEKDCQNLDVINKAGKPVTRLDQPADYRNKVVLKPWGYEFLVYHNDFVAIWFLRINKDHATSMHCHSLKKTSLSLLSGKALCNTFKNRNFMFSGDSLILSPGVFHSTKAMSLDGISVIEMETPPDKLDLTRLQDGYGRENMSYEGTSQMVEEKLDTYGYFHFTDMDPSGRKIMVNDHCFASLERYSSQDEFLRSFVVDAAAIYYVCQGALFTCDGIKFVDVGETERGTYLNQVGGIVINGETILMKTTVF